MKAHWTTAAFLIFTGSCAAATDSSLDCDGTAAPCSACGCSAGRYCDLELERCVERGSVGEPCNQDEACESDNCGRTEPVCRVRIGAPCSTDVCDLCLAGVYCSTACEPGHGTYRSPPGAPGLPAGTPTACPEQLVCHVGFDSVSDRLDGVFSACLAQCTGAEDCPAGLVCDGDSDSCLPP